MNRMAGGSGYGLLVRSDTATYDGVLTALVTEHALAERLPTIDMERFGLVGWDRAASSDAGVLSEPVGAPTDLRRAGLAERIGAFVVAPGMPIHGDDAPYAELLGAAESEMRRTQPTRWLHGDALAELPTLWCGVRVPSPIAESSSASLRARLNRFGHVSVLDPQSKKHLEMLGLDVEVTVMPHPGVLADSVLPLRVLARRQAFLQVQGWLPAGEFVVIEGSDTLVPLAGQIAAAIESIRSRRPALGLVTITTSDSPATDRFATVLSELVSVPMLQMPAGLGPHDIAGVLHASAGVITTSPAVAATALALGRQAIAFEPSQLTQPNECAAQVGGVVQVATSCAELVDLVTSMRLEPDQHPEIRSLQAEADRQFDRVASEVERCIETQPASSAHRLRRAPAGEVHALRRAHEVRGRRLLAQGTALSEALVAERSKNAQLQAERADHLAEQAARVAEIEALRAELAARNADVAAALVRVGELEAQVGSQADLLSAEAATADRLAAQLAAVEHDHQRLLGSRLVRKSRPLRQVYSWFLLRR